MHAPIHMHAPRIDKNEDCEVVESIAIKYITSGLADETKPVTYTEGFSYWYTSIDTLILATPKNKPIFAVIFSTAGCFFLLNLSKVCFQVRKHTLSFVNHPQA